MLIFLIKRKCNHVLSFPQVVSLAFVKHFSCFGIAVVAVL